MLPKESGKDSRTTATEKFPLSVKFLARRHLLSKILLTFLENPVHGGHGGSKRNFPFEQLFKDLCPLPVPKSKLPLKPNKPSRDHVRSLIQGVFFGQDRRQIQFHLQ